MQTHYSRLRLRSGPMTERRGGWPGPRKVEINVTMPPDQLRQVEAYANAHGINRSEAIRRLVAAGLHHHFDGNRSTE
jgi:hypothetical protein